MLLSLLASCAFTLDSGDSARDTGSIPLVAESALEASDACAGVDGEPAACPLALSPVAAQPALAVDAGVTPSAPLTSRLREWLAANPMISEGAYPIDAGETAWQLAQSIRVPVWVLRDMNPTLDLDNLKVGDWLFFPITEKNEWVAESWNNGGCGC